jgi:hypothetical protein
MVRDPNNLPEAARKLLDILDVANIHPKVVDGVGKVVNLNGPEEFVFFVAPNPVT